MHLSVSSFSLSLHRVIEIPQILAGFRFLVDFAGFEGDVLQSRRPLFRYARYLLRLPELCGIIDP